MPGETENKDAGNELLQQRNAKEAVYAMLGRCEIRLAFFWQPPFRLCCA